MKNLLYYIPLILFLLSCSNSNFTIESCEFSESNVEINYLLPTNFNKDYTLSIDDIDFKHTYYLDSIKLGNYLPKEKTIFLTVEDRNAEERTTKISMGSILAKKLHRTGKYSILNGPQILTQGIVKFNRKDGKDVIVKVTKNYPALINQKQCTIK